MMFRGFLRYRYVNNKNELVRFLFSVLVVWGIITLTITRTIAEDNMIYAIGQLRSYSSEYFIGNVYYREGVISPRFISDFLFGLLLKMNGENWQAAVLLVVYFSAAVQSVAIANFGKRLFKEHMIMFSAVFAFAIICLDNNLAGFSLLALASSSIGLSLALAFWAISYVVGGQKDFRKAWILAAVSIVFHIHEGVYCSAIIFLILIAECIRTRKILFRENWTFLIAFAMLLLVMIPNMMTDSMELTNEEFVYIYSYYRHPHHLVPSTWGVQNIFNAACVILCFFAISCMVCFFLKRDYFRNQLTKCILLMSAWSIALLGMYVFTEKIPLAFVSTMFISKFFKYVFLLALVWLLYAAFLLWDNGNALSSSLIMIFAFLFRKIGIGQIVATIVLMAVIILEEHGKMHITLSKRMWIVVNITVGILICLIRQGPVNYLVDLFIITVFGIILITRLLYKNKNKGRTVIVALFCIVLMFVPFYGRLFILDSNGLTLLSSEDIMCNTMGEELYNLAVAFGSDTDADATFLANPRLSDTGWFQLVSRRNCFVSEKIIPSVKCSVGEWYDRMNRLNNWFSIDPECFVQLMKEKQIDYILVNNEYSSKMDECDDLLLYKIGSEGHFKIYKLIME